MDTERERCYANVTVTDWLTDLIKALVIGTETEVRTKWYHWTEQRTKEKSKRLACIN